MFDFIIPLGIMTIIGATMYALFELYARRKERVMMIEKMNFPNEGNIMPPNYTPFNLGTGGKFTALKIGLLLMGVGFGLMLAYCMINGVLPESLEESSRDRRYDREMIYGASTLFFGGVGMLTAFIIEYKITRRSEK